MIELRNGRVALALHNLQEGQGATLLLLHELGGDADDFRAQPVPWSGPIYALDLSGHGRSGHIYGAGYYPEMWAADADSALSALAEAGAESVVVLGRGLGAYVALLLAGARNELVHCAVLCEGEGLFGGSDGWVPGDLMLPDVQNGPRSQGLQRAPSIDEAVLATVHTYPRPAAYVARFAERARSVKLVESGAERPAWWRAVAEVSSVVRVSNADQALK